MQELCCFVESTSSEGCSEPGCPNAGSDVGLVLLKYVQHQAVGYVQITAVEVDWPRERQSVQGGPGQQKREVIFLSTAISEVLCVEEGWAPVEVGSIRRLRM